MYTISTFPKPLPSKIGTARNILDKLINRNTEHLKTVGILYGTTVKFDLKPRICFKKKKQNSFTHTWSYLIHIGPL